MSDPLLDHERRLTRLEDRFEVNIQALLDRLAKLEGAAEQARVNKEQAERREAADLRNQLAEAQKAS